MSDQSTEGFLLSYKRFTALRGHPKKVWSDPGSNFVGAKSALKDLYEFLERVKKPKLEEEAVKHGTEWFWKVHPANSPHRNGAAEAAVRVVKEPFLTWGVKVSLPGENSRLFCTWQQTWQMKGQ